jgi:hypothetical protein
VTRQSDGANLRDGLQTARGEGFGPASIVEPGAAEVKWARLVFSTRGRPRNFVRLISVTVVHVYRDSESVPGGKSPRNVLLREPVFSLSTVRQSFLDSTKCLA